MSDLFSTSKRRNAVGYPVHTGCGGGLLPAELTRQDTGTHLVCNLCHKGVNGTAEERAQADKAARAEGFDLDAARANKRLVLKVQAAPAPKHAPIRAQQGLFGAALGPPAKTASKGRPLPKGQGSLF
jgi:hypothetical protein